MKSKLVSSLSFFAFGVALIQGLFRNDWQWTVVALMNLLAGIFELRREHARQLAKRAALERFKHLS